MASKSSMSTSRTHSSHPHRQRRHRSARTCLSIVHGLNATLAFVSLCIFAAIVPLWNANFFHKTGIARGDWPDGLPILPLAITFVSSIYALTSSFLRHRGPTVLPGDYLKSRSKSAARSPTPARLQMYLTLTILILLMVFLILSGLSGLYRFWRPAVITSSVAMSSGTASSGITLNTLSLRSITDTNPVSLTPPTSSPSGSSEQTSSQSFHSCTLANVFTRRCNPTLYMIGDLQIAAIACASFVWLLNLVLLVFHARDYQYLRRKHHRSLRTKARAKLDILEDEFSKAEKGQSAMKKIHHERRRGHTDAESGRTQTPADSTLGIPPRAYTVPTRNDATGPAVRPKQHYYNPTIVPSRSRSLRENNSSSESSQLSGRTAYSGPVEDTGPKPKPAEKMRDWLAARGIS